MLIKRAVMKSLAQEIQGFSKAHLKKQSTRVTTVTGKRIIESRSGTDVVVTEDSTTGNAFGFVQDLSLDLQVGTVKPFLLLSSQDAAQDIDTLRKFKVSHVLNVAYGVENAFPELFTYKTVTMLDLPETDITSCFPECFEFIDQVREQNGIVLLHCNAGVSRSASVAIGYLMSSERMSFEEACKTVKLARPSIRPNPGFLEQLKNYKP
ncbi:dual specificity protein phosphatase 19b [Chanos chanos]|uniref:Dual specificity protein phosphatase 19b n=1 Tax=Chanos chanos TaxID=29144 RepID=A0A6J2W075_CHACN|nr:dual specificity protein phosphatase 19-like [Chanos chanos]